MRRRQMAEIPVPQPRIVLGQDAAGAVDYPFFGHWFRGCGSTLIHSDILLTAAHCYSETYQDHRVKLEGDATQLHSVVDYRIHPQFNDDTNYYNNNEYDFMLLKLESPVPEIRPVPLHNDKVSLPLYDEEDLTIIGYGLMSEDGPLAKTLQEASVQYHHDCSFSTYRPGKVGEDTMFCAHRRFNDTHAVDSCQGDSGGPILRKTPQGWMQVGVTSWGEGCARPDAPGIYARVAVAQEWIQATLCQLSQMPPPHCTEETNTTIMEQAAAQEEGSPEVGQWFSQYSAASLSSTTSTTSNSNANSPSPTPTPITGINATTTVRTIVTALQIEIHYDAYPQEISWALALQLPDGNSKELLHISQRQPVTRRNQWVSQEIKDIEPGSTFLLEFYDTVAGDGILTFSDEPAIRVWQIQTELETRFVTVNATTTTTTSTKELESRSTLLWTHPGDFGEFVQTTVQVR